MLNYFNATIDISTDRDWMQTVAASAATTCSLRFIGSPRNIPSVVLETDMQYFYAFPAGPNLYHRPTVVLVTTVAVHGLLDDH